METKKEIIHTTIEKIYYVSVDGIRFEDKDKCIARDKYVEEHKKVCPYCNGLKRFYRGQEEVYVEPEFRGLDDGMRSIYEDCPVCKGRGYILQNLQRG